MAEVTAFSFVMYGARDAIAGGLAHIDVGFRPSEVRYQMDPETYRVHLADFGAEPGTAEAVP